VLRLLADLRFHIAGFDLEVTPRVFLLAAMVPVAAHPATAGVAVAR